MSPLTADAGPQAPTRAPTVLVLGATGFIGQTLVRELRRTGVVTRALVRSRSAKAAVLADQSVELMVGDFKDPARLDAALAGVRHVYHLARGAGSTWDDYLRNDVTPTRQLAERCAALGIWLYYTSSIAIYHGGRDGEVIDETTPASSDATRVNVYARAKVENEKLITELVRERGLQAVIFRPGIVIGAGGSPYPAGVGAWPSDTLCRPWGGGHQRLPFVLVDDCADAMVRASQVQGLAGETFNLVGDALLTGNDYLEALEHAAGVTIRRASLPTWWLYTRSLAKWSVLRLMGRAPHASPTYRYFDGLVRRGTFSPAHARQLLGWSPASEAAALVDRGIRAAVRARQGVGG